MQKDFSQKSMVSRENALEKWPKKSKKSILLHNKLKSQKIVESKDTPGYVTISDFNLLWSKMDFFDFLGHFSKGRFQKKNR